MSERKDTQSAITWVQVHNLIPLIGAVIGVLGVFNVLSNKVSILEQKMEYTNATVTTCNGNVLDLQKQLSDQQLSLKEIEGQVSSQRAVKGAYTSSSNALVATPTPKP